MKVKINTGQSTVVSTKTVRETLGLSLQDATYMVKEGQFECPDEMFTKLNDLLQHRTGGFLEPVAVATTTQCSEVNVKTTVESLLAVTEEWVKFVSKNEPVMNCIVTGLIGSLKPSVSVRGRKEKGKFMNVVSIEIENPKEIEAAKILAVHLNSFIVDSINKICSSQAAFKHDFNEWYCKDDEHES